MKIAIVDDSITARMFIRQCLEIIGFGEAIFIEAEHGRDALDKIKKEPVDILLSDLTMPVMDGETLLRRIKASPNLYDLPVLIITSAGNPAKEKELIELGAMAVLPKPVSPASLNRVLETFISEGAAPNE